MNLRLNKKTNKVEMELNENEFFLISHLVEKSAQRTKRENKIFEPLDVKIDDLFKYFIYYEF